MGAAWAVGDMSCTTYNHVGGPNSLTCASMGGMMMGGPTAMVNMSVQIPPSSEHPGGVNLLMGDGSVRFIKNHDQPGRLASPGHAQRRRDHQCVGLLTRGRHRRQESA